MEIDRVDIATRLIEERGRTGYSQADFARQLDISREGLRLYEMGQRAINAEFLAKAAGLGVDVQYVLTGVRSKNAEVASKANSPIFNAGPGSKASYINEVSSGAYVNIGDVHNGDVHNVHTNKHVTKVVAEVKPGIEHITDLQAAGLKRLVNEIVDLEQKYRQKPATYQSVWSTYNNHFKVPSYRMTPLSSYDQAEKYLRQWIGRLSSQKRASKDDEVRKRRYAYIKINTKDDESWLKQYIGKRFGVSSLTELTDEQLQKTYSAVAARKSKR